MKSPAEGNKKMMAKMKNKKISFVVSPGLEMELKAIPDTEYYSDISEFLEDAVKTLMDARRDLRVAIACALYEKGKISLGRAMEIAGVDTDFFSSFFKISIPTFLL